jgi:hypothetical protein
LLREIERETGCPDRFTRIEMCLEGALLESD